jgi:cytochrome oxidase assembly protein ShyY1
VPLTGSYVQLIDNQPGGLGVLPLPHLDAGPFLSYGIQWIVFGIVAPIGLGYFVYSELKARRREREAQQAAASRSTEPDAAPVSVEEKLADRYGRRR